MVMPAEDRTRSHEERTLKDLSPNVSALLCYVAGWVSGIVFLVLEQKNYFVRFHALQSIIVFGTLTAASLFLGALPVVGVGFHWAIGVAWFILLIILIVKAASGEAYKMPWAGNLAERLASESMRQSAPQDNLKEQPAASAPESKYESALPTQITRSSRVEEFKADYYSWKARSARLASYAFAIAWSLALLIFFNFYSQYIAYYEPIHSGAVTHWHVYTVVTAGYQAWLPILTATLVLSIIGYSILIAFDKYILNRAVHVVLNVFSVATILTLLSLFPFDFSAIPNPEVINILTIGLPIALIVLAVGFGIGALVEFIKLVVHAVEGKY